MIRVKMTNLSLSSLVYFCVFVKWSYCALNLADVDCGYSKAPFVRIKNGVDALPGELPWIVPIHLADVRGNGTIYTCVGSIIHNQFVLTAAHCVQSFKAKDIVLMFGEHTRSKISKFERRIPVERVLVHPHYIITGTQVYSDVALLELGEGIVWNRFTRPICLPSEEEDDDYDMNSDPLVGRTVTVAGWGLSDELLEGGELADTLQKVDLKVLSLPKCTEWIEKALGMYHPLRATQLCAGIEEGGKDACTGDSGGPLMLRNANGQQVAIGIVSSGFGCGRRQQPGVYTRVSKFVDWIIETIESSGHYIHSRNSNESLQ
ncbi:clotting factor B-like [Palaemon carinicauda]|uniref:clotting factor B-like n=1 Tax=Palaemon carinicauda TaxID=392227 RepID=UPI0035B5837E